MTQQNHGEMQEEARNRAFQSRMEWLKAVFEFYKHFMSVAFASIAAVAAVAALVGRAFKNTLGTDAPWQSNALVGAAVVLFLIAGGMSIQGMHLARRNILKLHRAKSECEFEEMRKWRWGPKKALRREVVWAVVGISYGFGLIAFGVFVLTAVFQLFGK